MTPEETVPALRRPVSPELRDAIAYAEAGPPEAPAVVLIPGGGGAVAGSAMAAVWRSLADDHRSLVVETRGAPGATMEPGGFGTADMARDVVGLLDELGIERAYVAGASLGSMIGQHVLADLGPRALGGVLALTGPGGDAFFGDLMAHLAAVFRHLPREALRAPLLWGAAGDGYSRWRGALPPDEQLAQVGPNEPLARRFEAGAAHDARDRLAGITAPVHVVAAEHDAMLRPALGRALAEALPDASYELLPGRDHLCFNDEPGLFTALFRKAAAQRPPAGPGTGVHDDHQPPYQGAREGNP